MWLGPLFSSFRPTSLLGFGGIVTYSIGRTCCLAYISGNVESVPLSSVAYLLLTATNNVGEGHL